ncbi:MAG TPA: 6-pyruvoyl-tetrahydropterin synthase-related protein [Pyrinomonadaceae bacterium]|jgi:hypothetical protein|nr:6-pyruvoyl-tetrahydropterin synthase-related protein [Pyrinomonadaceae bacterium]
MAFTLNLKQIFLRYKHDVLALAGVCLVALCMMLPIWIAGIPKGNDLPQHFQFAVTIRDALQAGDYYPSWMPNENKGYGGIGMRFYPPVGYYALALGKMLTGNWYWAACLVFWFWLSLSGISGYFWSRERSSPGASFIGGAVFVVAPYHINEIYNAFNYAEFAAVAFLPFCFLFVDRLARNGKLGNLAGLSVSFALLILSNLPIAVMGTAALGVYSLVSLPRKNLIGTALKLGAGFILGLALSAFYWIKIVTEMAWLNHSSETYSSGSVHYDYRINFLLQTKYLVMFDDRDMWFANMVLGCTLLLTLPLGFLYWRSVRSFAAARLNRVWIVLAFSIFMATYLSIFVWDNVAILQKVQFPWRWLSVISLAGIPLAAAGWKYCAQWLKDERLRRYALIVVGILLFSTSFTVFQVIRAANFYPRGEFEEVVAPLGDAPQNCDCWLPVWAKNEAMKNQEKVSAGGREVSGLVWERKDHAFTLGAGEPAKVRMATFYYPLWQIKINDEAVAASPAADGALTFDAPTETSRISVKFIESPAVVRAQILSIICWALLAIAALAFSFGKIRVKSSAEADKADSPADPSLA